MSIISMRTMKSITGYGVQRLQTYRYYDGKTKRKYLVSMENVIQQDLNIILQVFSNLEMQRIVNQ